MFLLEGFCFKNNIYCKYCEKVILKKDYNSHFNNHFNNSPKQKNIQEGEEKKNTKSILINQINYNSCLNMNFNKILKTKEFIKINDPIIITTTDKQLNTIDEYREFFLRNY